MMGTVSAVTETAINITLRGVKTQWARINWAWIGPGGQPEGFAELASVVVGERRPQGGGAQVSHVPPSHPSLGEFR